MPQFAGSVERSEQTVPASAWQNTCGLGHDATVIGWEVSNWLEWVATSQAATRPVTTTPAAATSAANHLLLVPVVDPRCVMKRPV